MCKGECCALRDSRPRVGVSDSTRAAASCCESSVAVRELAERAAGGGALLWRAPIVEGRLIGQRPCSSGGLQAPARAPGGAGVGGQRPTLGH